MTDRDDRQRGKDQNTESFLFLVPIKEYNSVLVRAVTKTWLHIKMVIKIVETVGGI